MFDGDFGAGSGPSGVRGMGRLARGLPYGVEVFHLRPDGRVLFADREGARELGPSEEFLRFIDDGQFAHYLVGDARTSPERPSNATYKLGVVGPRSAFTPHAHGGEHIVLSLGHASCGVYDPVRRRVTEVRLFPGAMIRIPEMMPHSFANRGARPLNILAANTGFGIDHEDYAITADEAERRAVGEGTEGAAGSAGVAGSAGSAGGHGLSAAGRAPTDGRVPTDGGIATAGRVSTAGPVSTDYAILAAALRDIERVQRVGGVGTVSARERLAAGLRRAAAVLEGPR
ncbi:cupin domain-containing protein [Streptomyces sp. NPDC127033]|uniref:cupin domain-containing protein n=1 Tax=Streptomyces sp. NPDC127033 TaxID=3347110 RepID=UPI0036694DEE